MTPAQEESWRILLDLYAEFPDGVGALSAARWSGCSPTSATSARSGQPMMSTSLSTSAPTSRPSGACVPGWAHAASSSRERAPTVSATATCLPRIRGLARLISMSLHPTTSASGQTSLPPCPRGPCPRQEPRQPSMPPAPSRCPSATGPGTSCALRFSPRSLPRRLPRPSLSGGTGTGTGVDAAFLLSLVPDPVAAATGISSGQRRGLRVLKPLLDENHRAWRPLGERSRLGNTTLRFLLDT
jgi:hypothetical protein